MEALAEVFDSRVEFRAWPALRKSHVTTYADRDPMLLAPSPPPPMIQKRPELLYGYRKPRQQKALHSHVTDSMICSRPIVPRLQKPNLEEVMLGRKAASHRTYHIPANFGLSGPIAHSPTDEILSLSPKHINRQGSGNLISNPATLQTGFARLLSNLPSSDALFRATPPTQRSSIPSSRESSKNPVTERMGRCAQAYTPPAESRRMGTGSKTERGTASTRGPLIPALPLKTVEARLARGQIIDSVRQRKRDTHAIDDVLKTARGTVGEMHKSQREKIEMKRRAQQRLPMASVRSDHATSTWMEKRKMKFIPRLDAKMKKDLESMFQFLDEDGGGTASVDEIQKAFAILGHNLSNSQINSMVSKFDQGTGELTYAQFVDFMLSHESQEVTANLSNFPLLVTSYLTRRDIATLIFNNIDIDGGGLLELDEIMLAFEKLGLSHSEEEVESMMNKVDKEKKGAINIEEFMALLNLVDDNLKGRRNAADEGEGEGDVAGVLDV